MRDNASISDEVVVAKAELRELKPDGDEKTDSRVAVQFNPETLKVSFANQIVPPPGGGDKRGTAAMQFVGKGTTKLSVQLWFDVTSAPNQADGSVTDVRELTKKVAYFITPQAVPNNADAQVPPGVRFVWGSFQFDGMMDSLEESLEFFSAEGVPLRANLTLSLSQQNIQFAFARKTGPSAGPGGAAAGTKALTQAPAGATLQGLAAAQGLGDNWQNIGRANGVENPRRIAPGQFIDLDVTPPGVTPTGG